MIREIPSTNNEIIHQPFPILLIALIVFLTPIRRSAPSILGFSIVVYLSILLFIYAGYRFILKRNKIRLVRFHVYTILFFIWAITSISWSTNPNFSISMYGIRFITAGAMSIIFFNLIVKKEHTKLIILSYLISCLLLGIDIIINYSMGVEYLPNRYTALGLNPNITGMYLSLGLPLALWLVYNKNGRSNIFDNIIYHSYFVLGSVGVFLTGSRGAMVAAIIPLLYYGYVTFTDLFNRSKEIAIIISVLTGLLITYILPMRTFMLRLFTIWHELGGLSIGNRYEIWKNGFYLYQQHILRGIGWGSFPYDIEPYLGETKPPESSIFGVLYQLGLVGFLIFISILKSISHKVVLNHVWLLFVIVLFILFSVNDWVRYSIIWMLLSVMVADLFDDT